jgi:hypothetical protein
MERRVGPASYADRGREGRISFGGGRADQHPQQPAAVQEKKILYLQYEGRGRWRRDKLILASLEKVWAATKRQRKGRQKRHSSLSLAPA